MGLLGVLAWRKPQISSFYGSNYQKNSFFAVFEILIILELLTFLGTLASSE